MIRIYTSVLELPEDAWDIYMIYGPEARWDGKLPPKPEFWMHQLGNRVDGLRLDPTVFAKRTTDLLAAK